MPYSVCFGSVIKWKIQCLQACCNYHEPIYEHGQNICNRTTVLISGGASSFFSLSLTLCYFTCMQNILTVVCQHANDKNIIKREKHRNKNRRNEEQNANRIKTQQATTTNDKNIHLVLLLDTDHDVVCHACYLKMRIRGGFSIKIHMFGGFQELLPLLLLVLQQPQRVFFAWLAWCLCMRVRKCGKFCIEHRTASTAQHCTAQHNTLRIGVYELICYER